MIFRIWNTGAGNFQILVAVLTLTIYFITQITFKNYWNYYCGMVSCSSWFIAQMVLVHMH